MKALDPVIFDLVFTYWFILIWFYAQPVLFIVLFITSCIVNGESNGQGPKHIDDRSTGTEGYLEYTKENEKAKVNQLDVGNEKNQQNSGSNIPKTSKNSKNKTKWPTLEQVIKITSH